MALTKVDQTMVSDQVFGRRNLFINGKMQVAQRGTSATGATSSGYYTVDRWQFIASSAGTWTVSQSTTVPSGEGFAYSHKFDCTTADASLGASDYLVLGQKIEGINLQQLKYGTSSAEKLTLSFWVRSAKTGTYVVEYRNANSGGVRQQSQSYTISSADTWEKKTITIDGDTASTFENTINSELEIYFWLAAGSSFTSGSLNTSWGSDTTANRVVGQVNLADSTSNDWYITGVQLEAGDKATPFEHLSLAEELALCQRYFMSTAYPNNFSSTQAYTTDGYWLYQGLCNYADGQAHDMYMLPVTMRATPTPTPYAPSGLVSGYGGGSTKLAAYASANASWKAADINQFSWASTPSCSAFRVDYDNSSEDNTGGMWIGGFEFDAEL
jgi:hypothetical protein